MRFMSETNTEISIRVAIVEISIRNICFDFRRLYSKLVIDFELCDRQLVLRQFERLMLRLRT